ncbi:MAG: serine/threonine-protein phosphatase [Prevotella sp.]|nr:serine/threonine-protein phosphatase [Prevotella sp.]
MPDRIVSQMNHDLNENNKNFMFVTLFVGILDLTSGLLRYCNAGHEAPILIHQGVQQLSVNRSYPVGPLAKSQYQTQEVIIEPGSTILFYTDGLNEAMKANYKMFGIERVFDEVNRAIQAGEFSPKVLIERMTQAVNDFIGDDEQSDDLTMMAIRR